MKIKKVVSAFFLLASFVYVNLDACCFSCKGWSVGKYICETGRSFDNDGWLDLDGVGITIVDGINKIGNCDKGKILRLAENKIEILYADAFVALPNLEILNLWYNTITKFESGCFNGLNNLKELRFDFCNGMVLTGLQDLITAKLALGIVVAYGYHIVIKEGCCPRIPFFKCCCKIPVGKSRHVLGSFSNDYSWDDFVIVLNGLSNLPNAHPAVFFYTREEWEKIQQRRQQNPSINRDYGTSGGQSILK